MTIQMAIIGLGQIGASIGLALVGEKERLRRIGHDREAGIAHQAEKMGAIDQVEMNLPRAVRNADVVLLALPVDQVRETLEVIGPDLKEHAVVMDTCPVKEVVANWVGELVPENRHYVGLTPVINAQYLHEAETGIDAARSDLFHNGLMAIIAPSSANSESIKLAVDLTQLLGASPFFADLLEVDGLMAATHLLPQLLAAALLNATVDQPGWREARKMTGRSYAQATSPLTLFGEAHTLTASAMFNRENALRLLDNSLAALSAIRNDIEARDEAALDERLKSAHRGRLQWWSERQKGDWLSDVTPKVDLPENPGVMGRLFGVRRKPKSIN